MDSSASPTRDRPAVTVASVLPAVHVQVHALGLLEAAEVGRHLRLLHGLALQVGQPLDQLDALVVPAVDEGLLRPLQVQLLQRRLGQQTPAGRRQGQRGSEVRYRTRSLSLCHPFYTG